MNPVDHPIYAQTTAVMGPVFSHPEIWNFLTLKTRAEYVRDGKLFTYISYQYEVPLAPDLVDIHRMGPLRKLYLPGCLTEDMKIDPSKVVEGYHTSLNASAQRAFDATVAGPFEIRFNDEGHAFIRFKNADDATLFRLALEGGAR